MQGIFDRRTGWQLHSEPHSPMTLARITAMCNHIALSHVGGCCVHETCGIRGLHVVHGEFLEVRDPVLGSVSRTMVLWSYIIMVNRIFVPRSSANKASLIYLTYWNKIPYYMATAHTVVS